MSLLKVTFVQTDGAVRTIEDALPGWTVMEVARANDIEGILADCGGGCACATCHVYVDPDWLSKVGTPVPGSQEASMLSFAAAAEPNSRLSCQIPMREDLDGIVLRMPEGQH